MQNKIRMLNKYNKRILTIFTIIMLFFIAIIFLINYAHTSFALEKRDNKLMNLIKLYRLKLPVAKIYKITPKNQSNNTDKFAKIIGDTSGLPYITMSVKKLPLWKILENLSEKTKYTFSAENVNLARCISINKININLAYLLSHLFPFDKTIIKVNKKAVIINGE